MTITIIITTNVRAMYINSVQSVFNCTIAFFFLFFVFFFYLFVLPFLFSSIRVSRENLITYSGCSLLPLSVRSFVTQQVSIFKRLLLEAAPQIEKQWYLAVKRKNSFLLSFSFLSIRTRLSLMFAHECRIIRPCPRANGTILNYNKLRNVSVIRITKSSI